MTAAEQIELAKAMRELGAREVVVSPDGSVRAVFDGPPKPTYTTFWRGLPLPPPPPPLRRGTESTGPQ